MAAAPLLKRQAAKEEEEMEKPSAEMSMEAFQLCKEYLGGGWGRMTPKDFQLTVMGGGLTNKLYVCTLLRSNYQYKEDEFQYPNTVLLRVYGLILRDFKAQIQESVVFSILAERGIGPHLYAVFPGGRIEEYVPSYTLKTPDLNDSTTSRNIAIRMSEYHRLQMPVKKDPCFIMAKLFNYLEKTRSAHFEDKKQQNLLNKFMALGAVEEVEFIKDMIAELDAVVVFCHNDVQEGNILRCNDSLDGNPVHLIDFEYSSYNYRGFDIANHFCEWMYDYSYNKWPFYSYKKENFPTKQQQRIFVDSYLNSMYEALPSRRTDPNWCAERVMYETDRFLLLSHLFWAFWSVRQAQISDIQFGYLEYALSRMDTYQLHKQEIMKETK